MWGLDHKEEWVPKNWGFQTVVLENTLESPLDSKEIKLVSLKGNQPWMFFGRTDAEAEAPVLWLPDAKSQLIRKDSDAGKIWRQKQKQGEAEEPRRLQSMGSQRVIRNLATAQQKLGPNRAFWRERRPFPRLFIPSMPKSHPGPLW